MRVSWILSGFFALTFVSMPLGAGVTVTFANPDRYTDAGKYSLRTDETVHEIERHLKRLGERYLSPQQTLRIEVLDIDLAGEEDFLRTGRDVRVLRGRADWPRIKLRYVLEADGRVSASKEETLTDMNYLEGPKSRYSSEALAYEKRMLDEWFKARFGAQRPAR